MKIFESMGKIFGQQEIPHEEAEESQKKEYIAELEAKAEAMKEARKQWQGAADTRVDAREITALENRIKELKSELAEKDVDDEENGENSETEK